MAVVEHILRVTDGASPALLGMAASASKADAATRTLTADLDRMEKQSGSVGSSSMKLAGALSLVSPEAAEAARTLGDLADVGEVAATAGKGLGLSMTSVLGILGPVAVAVGVLGAAYWALSADLEAVEEAQRGAAEAATAMQDAHRASTAAADAVKEAWELSVGLVTREELALRRATDALREQRAGVEGLMAAQVAALEVSLSTQGVDTERIRQLNAAKAALTSYRAETDGLAQTLADTTEMEAEKRAQAERERAAERDAAEAARAAEATARQQQAEQVATQRADEQSLREAQRQQAEDRKLEIEANTRAHEEEWRMILEKAEAERLAAEAAAQAAAQRRENQLNTATSFAGGPQAITSVISAAGPWGKVIAALMEVAGNLGGLGDQFTDFHVQLKDSIAELPKTLSENLGTWIQEGTEAVTKMAPTLIQNIADSLPGMIEGLIGMVGDLVVEIIVQSLVKLPLALVDLTKMLLVDLPAQLTDSDMWYDVGSSMIKGFMEGWVKNKFANEDGKANGESIGKGILAILTGNLSKNIEKAAKGEDKIFRTKGSYAAESQYVPSTGLYMLHEGEEVRSPGRARRSGGDTHITVTLGSGMLIGTPADLVRELNRSLGGAKLTLRGA